MVGDNRHNSQDSRVGVCSIRHVVGKPLLVWLSVIGMQIIYLIKLDGKDYSLLFTERVNHDGTFLIS